MRILIGVLVWTAFPAVAMNEFYSPGRSVRALGMGGAFHALSEGADALLYNPAGIAGAQEMLIRSGAQASVGAISGAPAVLGVMDESKGLEDVVAVLDQVRGKPIYTQWGAFASYLSSIWATGFLLMDTQIDVSFLGEQFDTTMDVTVISDSVLFLGYGKKVRDIPGLTWGANVKLAFRWAGYLNYSVLDSASGKPMSENPDTVTGSGVGPDLDLGVFYDFKWEEFPTRIAVTLANLLSTDFPWRRTGGVPPRLARTLNVGFGVQYGSWWIWDGSSLYFDLANIGIADQPPEHLGARTGNISKHIHVGTEVKMGTLWRLRTGLHQGYFTAGLGLHGKTWRWDLAYYAEELGNSPGYIYSPRLATSLAAAW